MNISIIVEGKNDRSKLKQLLNDDILIYCTYGTPGTKQLQHLYHQMRHDEVYIFTDNDASGKKIRSLLSDLFPDATHMYTRKGYHGVEGTPVEYLLQQIEKAGLSQYLLDTATTPTALWTKN